MCVCVCVCVCCNTCWSSKRGETHHLAQTPRSIFYQVFLSVCVCLSGVPPHHHHHWGAFSWGFQLDTRMRLNIYLYIYT
jgi:hypothetical protein